MAVTSLWGISGNFNNLKNVVSYVNNPEKITDTANYANLHQIDGVNQYAANELKTEKREFVSCLNLSGADSAAREMWDTKEFWQEVTGQNIKTGGRLCYHGYQSFAAGEVDAKTAHEIGIKMARELWGDRFQVVVATHCNTGHYHNHFVINSVSDVDGNKFYNSKEDYRKMRETSDRLCREYGLSVIEKATGKRRSRGEWEAEKDGRPTIRSVIRRDIDSAIANSASPNRFYAEMRNLGYIIITKTKDGGKLKHPKLIPSGGERAYRFDNLDPDGNYTLEKIFERIRSGKERNGKWDDTKQPYYGYYTLSRKYKGIPSVLFGYVFHLHIIAYRPVNRFPVPPYVRESVKYVNRFIEQGNLTAREHIVTYDDLNRYREKLKAEISALAGERTLLAREITKLAKGGGNAEKLDLSRKRREEVNEKIGKLRHDLKLCDEIAERTERIAEQEKILRQQEEKLQKGDDLNERGNRSGREPR